MTTATTTLHTSLTVLLSHTRAPSVNSVGDSYINMSSNKIMFARCLNRETGSKTGRQGADGAYREDM